MRELQPKNLIDMPLHIKYSHLIDGPGGPEFLAAGQRVNSGCGDFIPRIEEEMIDFVQAVTT